MKQIVDKKANSSQKVQSLSGLLKLRELESNNKQVLYEVEKMKKNLKIKFWDLWDKVATNMGMSDLVGERNMQMIGRIKEIIDSNQIVNRTASYETDSIHYDLLKEKNRLMNLQKIRFSDSDLNRY